MEECREEVMRKFDICPKEEKIVVGPTNKKMLTVQSIYHFLQINGYDINKIDVVSSKIPYRG